jgi:hypothetical protein
MMTPRVFVLALVCAVVALAVFAPATAKPAAACTILRVDLDTAAEEAKIVIVGEVIHERTIERVVFSREAYESTVGVRVALKGNPEREITFSPLGFLGADCSGGPRLPAGERVLLFIAEYNGELHIYGFDKYVLANGEASRQFAVADSLLEPPIPADDALRRVAAITGASPEQLAAALAFARDEPAPEHQPDAELLPTEAPEPELEPLPVAADEAGGAPVLLIVLASAVLAVLVSALIGLQHKRV